MPAGLFQILKDDAAKVLHSICQQILKTQQWPQDWKRSDFIPIAKKGKAKECSNYHITALISYAREVMCKILQARLQQYMNLELSDVQAGFRKGRGTRDQIANICWIIKKAREFQRNIYFWFIDYTQTFDCVNTTNWKILKETPMNCSTPGFPVHHQLPKHIQTHVHRVSDARQPSHPLSSLPPPTVNLSQHQGLF